MEGVKIASGIVVKVVTEIGIGPVGKAEIGGGTEKAIEATEAKEKT